MSKTVFEVQPPPPRSSELNLLVFHSKGNLKSTVCSTTTENEEVVHQHTFNVTAPGNLIGCYIPCWDISMSVEVHMEEILSTTS